MKKSIAYYAKLEWTLGRALERAEADHDVPDLEAARKFFTLSEFGLCANEIRDAYIRDKIDMPTEVKFELREAFWLMGLEFHT